MLTPVTVMPFIPHAAGSSRPVGQYEIGFQERLFHRAIFAAGNRSFTAARTRRKNMSKSEFPKIDLSSILTAKHLPAMSQTAIRLMELSHDPNKGPADYAVPIELDPGLTVQVLNFVNSSWFGFRDKISNVKRAASLVGIRTIKNFVLWNAVFNVISKPKCGAFCLVGLWQDSLRRALFARTFARIMGIKETDEIFTAALLQDMAVPLLAKELPDAYAKLFDARLKSAYRCRLSELEVYAFGWHHASAAKIVAQQWNLPESLAKLIEVHLNIEGPEEGTHEDPKFTAMSMSALLPAIDDKAWGEFEKFEGLYNQTRPVDGPSIEQLLGQIDKEFLEMAPMLRIPNPHVSLLEHHQGVVAAAM
jgi:HD-like signal output (HDOD) protein